MPSAEEKRKKATPSRIRFAERLREARDRRGWTQEQLGEAANLSWNYIGQVERKERNISIDNMDRLAEALGVPLADLLRDPEPAKDQPGSSGAVPTAEGQADR